MEHLRQLSFWRFKLFGWMFSAFGAAALLLAAIGVYGVLSYSVSQRTQEIGVRVALGAGRRDVMRLVVGQGLKLAAIGIVVGIVGALGITRYISTLLYNVTPSDPSSFTLVAMLPRCRRRDGELRAGAPRDGRRSDHRAEERVADFDRSGPGDFSYHRCQRFRCSSCFPSSGIRITRRGTSRRRSSTSLIR